MSSEPGAPQIASKVRELTLASLRVVKAQATVVQRRKLTADAVDGGGGGAASGAGPLRELVDAYGFTIHVDAAQRAALDRCAAAEARQRAKWAEWPPGRGALPPEARLKTLCRKGVPPELRRWVWAEVSGAGAARRAAPPGYFRAAVAGGRAAAACAHQIALDAPRTFPACAWAQSEAGQASLRRVLLAFAHHNPGVGYCQGMNFVACLLLVALGHDEEAAFWVLAALVGGDGALAPLAGAGAGAAGANGGAVPAANGDAAAPAAAANGAANGATTTAAAAANTAAGLDALQPASSAEGILYRDQYGADLAGCHVEMRSLADLVAAKLPRLAAHLAALRCDMSLLATDWFLCLFATSVPAEAAARVWDALLLEGPKVLFRVALALLRLHEPALLAADNPGDVLRRCRAAAAAEHDRDELMRVAFDGVGALPMARIAAARGRYQVAVDREFAARETRANLRQAVRAGYVLQDGEEALLAEPEKAGGGARPRWRALGAAAASRVRAATAAAADRAAGALERARSTASNASS
jgi:hypothetical protein